MYYEVSVSFASFLLGFLCVYILNVLSFLKINFYMPTFYWLRINNKYDFRLANRFVEREFFKFFLRKDN